jgi:phosphopantothenoylcysteine synthetase/decarboxylase
VTSAEFLELNDFKATATIIGNDNFWKYLFLMCRALYAPMRVLRLADQKTPAMDKLYYYILQADRMLLQYLKEAEEHVSSGALSDVTLEAITSASGISKEEDSDVMEDNSVENDGDDDSDRSSDDAEEDMEEEEDDDEFDTSFFDAPNAAAPLGGGINDSDG